jgi:hypothetical protein
MLKQLLASKEVFAFGRWARRSRRYIKRAALPTCCNQSEAVSGDQRLLLVYVPPFLLCSYCELAPLK